MEKMKELENRVRRIEERNKSVELDKKWETSFFRKALLTVFTYLAVLSYFLVLGISSPFLNAMVPTIGFLLSTLTLPFFKKIWMNHQH